MLDNRFRKVSDRIMNPIGAGLARIHITADVLTVFGLLAAGVTTWLIAIGEFRWAVLGLIVTGLPDLFDGAVARHTGKAGPRGAFFDSVVDRISDAALLGGAAWWFANGGGEPSLAVLALAVAVVSMMISYERAKAEALGYGGKGGLMERAERLIVLGVGLFFNQLEIALWVLLALGILTMLHRFVRVWREASAPDTGTARMEAKLRDARKRRAERLGRPVPPDGRALTFAEWWQSRRPGERRRRPSRSRHRG